MHRALANPELISLAAGFVDQASLPVEPAKRALDELLGDPVRARAALQYGTTKGYAELRELLLDRFIEDDGHVDCEENIDIEDIVVTAGSNQLLHFVSECLLNPGDIVLCPAPCYFVYLGLLKNLGARAVGVPMDQDGIVPEGLEETLQRIKASGELSRVKALYVVSYFDNPCGITLAADRRGPIVDLVKRWSNERTIHILDDAAYRELRYYTDDIPSLRAYDEEGDTVVVAQTFSKSFSPGVRVGYGILPKHLVAPVCNFKGNIDFGSPNFAQNFMHSVLANGLYEPHVDMLRDTYREKLEAMLDGAETHLRDVEGTAWDEPKGGLYVWLRVRDDVDTGPTGPLFDRAVEEGMLYVPGEYCYPAEGLPVPKNTMRLSFGVQPPNRIKEGMAALSRALRAVM